jgi:hypothetical protein
MKKKTELRRLIRNFAVELVIYSILLMVYFFAVLRFLGTFLTNLAHTHTLLYALAGLGLIVAQAVVLEALTSALMRWLHLER